MRVPFGKNFWRELPARVAVDAGRVHKEVAGLVLGHTLGGVGHQFTG